MPIDVSCPQCGFRGQVPDHAEGRSIKCRKCGNAFPVARSKSAAFGDLDAGQGLTRPPSRASSGKGRKLVLLVVAFSVLICMAAGAWLTLKNADGLLASLGGTAQSKGSDDKAGQSRKSRLPILQGNEQQLVKDHLVRNADDPTSVEIAEWGEPRLVLIGEPLTAAEVFSRIGEDAIRKDKGIPAPPVPVRRTLDGYEPGIILNVRWRANNRVGAKVLREHVFLIQEGKVVRSVPVERGQSSSPLGIAVSMLGEIAAEQVGEKLTRVAVCGTISINGVPFKATKKDSGEHLEITFHRARSDVHGHTAFTEPPRYENTGIPPGKYIVTVEWLEPKPAPTDPETDLLEGAYSLEKTNLSCLVTETQPVQNFDIDLKANIRKKDPSPVAKSEPKGEPVVKQQSAITQWRDSLNAAKQPAAKLEVITALSKLGSAGIAAVPDLIRLLKDGDETVRTAAIDRLATFGPKAKDAVPELIERVKQDDFWNARAAAATALADIDGDSNETLAVLNDRVAKEKDEFALKAIKDAIKRFKKQ